YKESQAQGPGGQRARGLGCASPGTQQKKRVTPIRRISSPPQARCLALGRSRQRTNSGKQNRVGARAVGAQAVLLPLLVMMSSQEADHWHIEILKEVVRLASHLPWTDRLCDFAGAQVR